ARETTAISQINSQAQKLDWLSVFSGRERRLGAQAQFRNARRRAENDRSHRDNQKRGEARQKVPVRDGRARCKSRSARQNIPLLASANNSGGYRQRYFSIPLR